MNDTRAIWAIDKKRTNREVINRRAIQDTEPLHAGSMALMF